MSQTQASNNSRVLPAFMRKPVNPNTDMRPPVQEDASVNAPGVQPDAPNIPNQTPAIPVSIAPPVMQQAPVPVQAPTPVQAPVSQPAYTPPPATDPVVDQYLMNQLEQERRALAARNAEQEQVIQNLLTAQQELDQIKAQQELQAAMAAEAFDDLETVDPEDAKRITNKVLNVTQRAIEPLRQEIEQQRRTADERLQAQQYQFEVQHRAEMNRRITEVHPDFLALQHNPAYHAFMQQRDGLSSKTIDQRAAEEFRAGNADYIIDVLNRLKGTIPSATQITTVAPVQTASSVATAATDPQAPPLTLKELNDRFQMRQITPDEYKRQVQAARAALYNPA